MKIEDQVCTFEQAKRLKQLGVDQDGLFCYISKVNADDTVNHSEANVMLDSEAAGNVWSSLYEHHRFSAFTVAELGVMLTKVPQEIRPRGFKGEFIEDKWVVTYKVGEGEKPRVLVRYELEAEMRADLLIRILEGNDKSILKVNK